MLVRFVRARRRHVYVAGRVRGVNDRDRASPDEDDGAGRGQFAIDAFEELEERGCLKPGRHAARRGRGKNPHPCS